MDPRTPPPQTTGPRTDPTVPGSDPDPRDCPAAQARKVIALARTFLKTVRHFFPQLPGWLDQLPDTRFEPMVEYHRRFLCWWGLLLFGLGLGRRRSPQPQPSGGHSAAIPPGHQNPRPFYRPRRQRRFCPTAPPAHPAADPHESPGRFPFPGRLRGRRGRHRLSELQSSPLFPVPDPKALLGHRLLSPSGLGSQTADEHRPGFVLSQRVYRKPSRPHPHRLPRAKTGLRTQGLRPVGRHAQSFLPSVASLSELRQLVWLWPRLRGMP